MADINLLTLNVGNSRLGVAVFIAGELQYSNRIPHTQRADWPGILAEAWARIANLEDPAIAAASVNPPLNEPLEQAIHSIAGKKIEWVGKDLDLPVKVLTESPSTTGVDRVLNIAAAYEQMQKACIVVDAGTAITIDVCNDAGEFLGGAIAPGASLQLASLHRHTAQLPLVPFETPTDPIARSTDQAILHGVYHGIRGMLKELVELYATHLGHWPDVIATGGDSPKLFADSELLHAISPDLIFYGIANAYTEHHIKHDS
ncbi:MAG TPA: type III pantothenate kinase [Tepidisphaeraceae bacterium]|jgi:type III pantothenate kinase|nr:type III pantothenate kinase [Tepidisphaeraceae bacterium]